MKKMHIVLYARFTIILLIILLLHLQHSEGKDQYVMPLSGGMKMSLQQDFCNVFNRPMGIASSIVTSVSLLGILFFGVLTAPFGYFFGIPSRKYVLGTAGADEEADYSDSSWAQQPRSLYEPNFLERLSNLYKYELFLDDFFYLMGEENEDCRFLALCYAHGAIKHLPKWMVEIYKIISARVQGMEDKYKVAIEDGLIDKSTCSEKYKLCSNPPFNLAIKSLLRFFPSNEKGYRKRKQEMYM